MKKYWKHYLLVGVVIIGIISMTGYKVSVLNDGPWLIVLILFTEISAGVSMFAQAMLRQTDPEAAQQAFSFSKWARLAMALVGIALFLENAVVVWDGLRIQSVKPGHALPFSAFLTYEISNGLMLLIEYMFSRMIAIPDKLPGINEKIRATHSDLPQLVHDSPDFWDQLGALVDRLVFETRERSAWEGLYDNLHKSANPAIPEGDRPEPSNRHKHLGETLSAQRDLAEIGRSMLGILFTVRPNVQAWYCPDCHEYNEAGFRAEKTCKHCNHKIQQQ